MKLARSGSPRGRRAPYLGLAREALADPSRTVRYFAALQLASLGPEQGRAAVPVLKEILAKESDPDLVDRAKLYLVRLDPDALTAEAAPPARGHESGGHQGWIRVRIYEKGSQQAAARDQPPGDARGDGLRRPARGTRRGSCSTRATTPAGFWERLKKTGKTDILTIEGDDGGRIQVWIE